PAPAAMDVRGHAMRAVDRMVMFSVVRTRLRVGLREGDHAGEREKGRDEFLLHHHSDCSREPQPPTTAGADWRANRARKWLTIGETGWIPRCAKSAPENERFDLGYALTRNIFADRGGGMRRPRRLTIRGQGDFIWTSISSKRFPTASRL